MNGRRIILALSTCLLTLLPGLANALSCSPPNAALELDAYLRADKTVYVMIATLAPSTRSMPDSAENVRSAKYQILEVRHVRKDGQIQDVLPPHEHMHLYATCAGSWCGQLPEQPGTYLLISSRSSRIVETGPCGGGIYPDPSADQLNAIRNCATEGRCSPDDIATFNRR